MRGVAVGCALVVAACADGNVASRVAKPPEFRPENQTRCGVIKSQARPLIVEWPSADRAALEAQSKRGLVAVRYLGCEMEILRQCQVGGRYGYTPLTRKRDRVVIRDTDDLYAKVPLGAARLEGTLARAGALDVSMTIVGAFDADEPPARLTDAQGECSRATHVVTSMTVGAFQFYAGIESELGGSAGVLGAEAGARSKTHRELINEDGNDGACERSTGTDGTPPDGCGALLRVEVVPVLAPGAIAAAVPPGRDLLTLLRKEEQANAEAEERAAKAARVQGTRLLLHVGSSFFFAQTRLPDDQSPELVSTPEGSPRTMELGGARTGLEIGLRRMLSTRWDVQARLGFGLLVVQEQPLVDGFWNGGGSASQPSAKVSDSSLIAMPADVTMRWRPSGRAFFLGLGPSIDLQSWHLRGQTVSTTGSPGILDVSVTTFVVGAVLETGLVFGPRETWELGFRGKAMGAQSRINPSIDLALVLGWAAL
jgi:hypothetical protein